MNGVLTTLLFVAMGSVVLALCTGLYSMMRGGEFNKKYGNKLMRARVILQFVALVLFALVLITSNLS